LAPDKLTQSDTVDVDKAQSKPLSIAPGSSTIGAPGVRSFDELRAARNSKVLESEPLHKKYQKIHWKLSPIFKKTIPQKITRLYRLCLWEAVDEVAGVSALP